ncbi:VOC family protein [Nocardia miyunensis]|uniref:VOC family protein n=1 Tax=Nocardia miyunensis TaxID=282684 RepID=UPI00082F7D94|nr:VOC family protein [Nocardia miyunensis]
MITGAHTIVYAADPDAARNFFRDVLGLAHVDAGNGWLIFRSPPAELAVHPAEGPDSGRCELYLMCDDLAATVEELRARGVEFTSDTTRERWGLRTTLIVPGAGEIGLYEPTHEIAHSIE